MTQVVHQRIRETAIAFAATVYDGAARNNEWYKLNKDFGVWLNNNWAKFIPHARQILAEMLQMSDILDLEKELIFDALLHDRSLPNSQQHGLEDLANQWDRDNRPGIVAN